MNAPARIAQPQQAPDWQSRPGDTGPRCHCFTVSEVVDLSPQFPPFAVFACRCPSCGRIGPQAGDAESARMMFADHIDAIHEAMQARGHRACRK